uniref:Glutamate--cysteine ligase n=1 Tax=Eptatretus burgeri TaxID=7764 RepID=A0A8C4X1B7_EPTBU
MGLLVEGVPLSWEQTKELAEYVHFHGIQQFINIYNRLKDRQRDVLKWGDEVEYMLLKFDHVEKKVHLLARSEFVLRDLKLLGEKQDPDHRMMWQPEFGRHMIEGMPGRPYGGTMADLNTVEANMRLRREEVLSVLQEDETVSSITVFPRFGCPGFTWPISEVPAANPDALSLFVTSNIVNTHPRFGTLRKNIKYRRGEKVAINVPIFRDKNTPSPFVELFSDEASSRAALPDHIYMDDMGFGMGSSCLQLTFQACSISEARYLYDQLAPLCPIMMALSAASPLYRGYVSDIDCRWSVIAASVDDRTREERGLEPLKNCKFRIHKSRYDSIDSYLSTFGEKYNDLELVKDEKLYEQLLQAGIDHLLAQHIAHLFIRDPLVIYSERIEMDDEQESDHFENIQSTNWQTMRFKPPPPNTTIGWRVEFRPTEVQLTDFENSAYVVFVVLLTRVILSYNLNFLIPLSKVDENLKSAQKRDAVRQSKFYFRKDIGTGGNPELSCCCPNVNNADSDNEEFTLMSIDTIINGKEGVFAGLIPIINSYLENMYVDVETRCSIFNYLRLIRKRASGELKTTSCWIRNFVAAHPDYKQDSVVSDHINYDLLIRCDRISRGLEDCPELFDKPINKSKLPTQPNGPKCL